MLRTEPRSPAYIKAMIPPLPAHAHGDSIGGDEVVPQLQMPSLTLDAVQLHSTEGPDLQHNFTGQETDTSGKLSQVTLIVYHLQQRCSRHLVPPATSCSLVSVPSLEVTGGIRTSRSWSMTVFLSHTCSGCVSAGGGVLLNSLSR